MRFIITDPISAHARDLLDTKGTAKAGGVVEWDIAAGCELTEEEMKALRRKHDTRGVNYRRATEVKRLMLEGLKCMEIVQALHRHYRQTQVKKDHAALAPYCGRGGAKKTRNLGQRPGK